MVICWLGLFLGIYSTFLNYSWTSLILNSLDFYTWFFLSASSFTSYIPSLYKLSSLIQSPVSFIRSFVRGRVEIDGPMVYSLYLFSGTLSITQGFYHVFNNQGDINKPLILPKLCKTGLHISWVKFLQFLSCQRL